MKNFTKEKLFEELSKWIESKREQITESTAHLLRFKTISGGKTDFEKAQFEKALQECFDYLETFSDRMGLKFKNYDGKVNVIEQPEGDKVVAIPVHIDVVPVGGGWRYPPFEGVIARGKLWGRGAQDDKGPAMACLFGLYALKELGLTFHTKTRMLIGTQEEVGNWSDIRHYLDREGAPDFGFTPDGLFPIINGEKGIMTLQICLECSEIPLTDNEIEFYELNGGDRVNIVPDYANLTFLLPLDNPESALKKLELEVREFLGNNEDAKIDLPLKIDEKDEYPGRKKVVLHFIGESAHGSLPWNGHNAILDGLKFFSKYQKYSYLPLRTYAEFICKSSLDYNGKGLDIYKMHDFIGATTVNLGMIRLSRKGGISYLNIRPPLGLTIKEIKERVEKVILPVRTESGINIYQKHEGTGAEALFVDPDKYPFYFNAMKVAYQSVTKKLPELKAIGGTTFAKALPNTVCFGPVLEEGDEKELAHMKDECVTIDELIRNTKIYGYALGLMTANLSS